MASNIYDIESKRNEASIMRNFATSKRNKPVSSRISQERRGREEIERKERKERKGRKR
jgi:hypothetical protein